MILFITALFLTAFSQKHGLKTINSDFLENLESPVLVLFHSSRCETYNCRQVLHFVENLQNAIENIPIVKFDLFFDPIFARREKLDNPPILRMYAYAETHDFLGALDTESIRRFVDRILNNETQSPIHNLDDEEYTRFSAKYESIFFYFFMQNCQPCQLSWPAFTMAAYRLQDNYPTLKFASVEATEENITEKFGVKYFPAFMLYSYGEIHTCQADGYANHRDLVNCIRGYLNPPKEPVPFVENVQTILNNLMYSEFIILGYFKEKDNNFDVFVEFAGKIGADFHVYYTMDYAVEEKWGVDHPSLLMFVPRGSYIAGAPKYYAYSGNFSRESLEEFVGRHLPVSIGQLTVKNSRLMFWRRPLCLFLFEVSWTKENYASTEYIRGNLIHVAKRRDNVSFAYSIPQIQNEARNFNFGISLDYSDFGLGCLDSRGLKYTYSLADDWDVEEIIKFVDQFTSGKAKEYRMSQPNKMRGAKSVAQLTGENFDRSVFTSGSNWLLFFYNSYDSLVQSPMRIFRQFAAEYSMTQLAFGEMDISTNDPHPHFFSYLVTNPVIIYYSENSTNVYSMRFDKQNLFNFVLPLENPVAESRDTGMGQEL